MRNQMNRRARLRLAGTLLAAASFTAMAAVPAAQAGEPEWIRQFGTPESDGAYGVAIGADHRVHVAGNSGASQVLITFDRDGKELWRRQWKTDASLRANGVATDADGTVYVVGAVVRDAGWPWSNFDVVLRALDRDGRDLWQRQVGSRSSQLGYKELPFGVAVGAGGIVAMVGETNGALGGGFKGGSLDPFVITYDSDGNPLWRRQPGTDGWDIAWSVAGDADGNIYVAGETYGALRGASKGNADAFVIKYDRDGRPVWKRQPGTTRYDWGKGVAADADGNVYLVGYTNGMLAGLNKGNEDAFAIKYDRDGRNVWRNDQGTIAPDYATGVAVGADGTIGVVGWTLGALAGDFKGTDDAFVILYDPDGQILWQDQLGTAAGDEALGTAIDTDGSVYVVGWTGGSLPGNTNLGSNDAFVIKYAPGGPQ